MKPLLIDVFPAQRASDAESVGMWWWCHVLSAVIRKMKAMHVEYSPRNMHSVPAVVCLPQIGTTVRSRYNVDNFLKNIHKIHSIARPLGRGMVCLLWINHLTDILPESVQSFMQYLIILDRAITALDSIAPILVVKLEEYGGTGPWFNIKMPSSRYPTVVMRQS